MRAFVIDPVAHTVVPCQIVEGPPKYVNDCALLAEVMDIGMRQAAAQDGVLPVHFAWIGNHLDTWRGNVSVYSVKPGVKVWCFTEVEEGFHLRHTTLRTRWHAVPFWGKCIMTRHDKDTGVMLDMRRPSHLIEWVTKSDTPPASELPAPYTYTTIRTPTYAVTTMTDNANVVTCERCGGACTPVKKCARCLSVAYCSVECQKADWRTHKPECRQPQKV